MTNLYIIVFVLCAVILIMNIMAPYIEKWTAGEPLGGVK